MKNDLAEVRRSIEKSGAAQNTAELVLRLAGTAVPAPSRWRPGFAM
jgi:hypothetical protein